MQIPIIQIDNSWTLFLDRDGVINHEKHKDYIHTWDEFVFYDGVHQAIESFSKIFHRIIIVTNQKGVGKGLTKIEDLAQIHNNKKASIQALVLFLLLVKDQFLHANALIIYRHQLKLLRGFAFVHVIK